MKRWIGLQAKGRAYARAALVGNPSDGYYGRTIAFTFEDFSATVIVSDSDHLEIAPGGLDVAEFDSIEGLVSHVEAFGYYGGLRLLKAAVVVFAGYSAGQGTGIAGYSAGQGTGIAGRGVRISYESTIPFKLGLGGSSAIVIGCLRALSSYFEAEIPPPVLANLALAAELDELDIPAGLQDRVAQSFDGLVFMDFDKTLMDGRGWGEYTALDAAGLPPLYIAYMPGAAEGSEVAHAELSSRHARGDSKILVAIEEWRSLTEQVRELIESGRGAAIGPLLDRNLEIRCELGLAGSGTTAMANAARAIGASANTTGSGGAIVGTHSGEKMFEELCESLGKIGATVISPAISHPRPPEHISHPRPPEHISHPRPPERSKPQRNP